MRAGSRVADFWHLTPYQTRLLLEAHQEAERDQQKHRVWAVWHTAALQRAKRLPKMDDLMPAERMTGKQAVKSLRGFFGGRKRKKPKRD